MIQSIMSTNLRRFLACTAQVDISKLLQKLSSGLQTHLIEPIMTGEEKVAELESQFYMSLAVNIVLFLYILFSQ